MSQYVNAGVPAPLKPCPVTYTCVASTTISRAVRPSPAVTSQRRVPVVVSNAAVIHVAPPTMLPLSTTSVPSGLKAADVATSLAKKPVEICCDHSSAPAGLCFCSLMSCPSPIELNARYELPELSTSNRPTAGPVPARSCRHSSVPSDV